MSSHLRLITVLIGMTFSIALPVVVCFHRKLKFARWARTVSILACITGMAWGILCLKLLDMEGPDAGNFRLDQIKEKLGGICIGLALSIIIARPYEKRVT